MSDAQEITRLRAVLALIESRADCAAGGGWGLDYTRDIAREIRNLASDALAGVYPREMEAA